MSTAVVEEDGDVLSDGFRSLESGLEICARLEGGGTFEANRGTMVDDLEQRVHEQAVGVIPKEMSPCRGRESRGYIRKRRMRARKVAARISVGSSGGNTKWGKDVIERERKRLML